LTERSVGVLLVEQFIEAALTLADHLVILRKGKSCLEMTPQQARDNRAAPTAACL